MLDCGQAEGVLLARLATPTRNRYYYGKLLDAYHLELEQRYGNNKRWLLNRLTLGTGVLCGLDVVADAASRSVRVTAGVAVDGVGREIVVPEPSIAVDPRQPTDECGRPDGPPLRGAQAVTVYVCYHECEAEPAPVLVSECAPERACENGLYRERYRLRVALGEAPAPGLVSEKQCARIFAAPPPDTSRRTVACETLSDSCAPDEETCVPLAIVRLDADGGIDAIETCAARRRIYSNAVLLDLILCLARRVDDCCPPRDPPPEEPPVRVKAIAAASPVSQGGVAGQEVASPPIALVTRGGVPVASEPVTFDIVPPGGELGDNPASPRQSFPVVTAADGRAALGFWRLGAQAGAQRVTASIVGGSPTSVDFLANVRPADVELPVVLRAWPPNATILRRESDDPEVPDWARTMARRPRIELAFNHEMSPAQLGAPDAWLRVVVLRAPGQDPLARRVMLRHRGRPQDPVLPGPGFTEIFTLEELVAGELKDARWVVMIRADAGNIVDTSTPPLLLDADYRGANFSITAADPDLDALWNVTSVQQPVPPSVLAKLVDTVAPLPSGNDGEGGRFVSWFQVEGVGP